MYYDSYFKLIVTKLVVFVINCYLCSLKIEKEGLVYRI